MYEVKGSVRGRIYKGTSISAALKKLADDRKGCKKQGGYSDCSLWKDGDLLPVYEDDDGQLYVEEE